MQTSELIGIIQYSWIIPALSAGAFCVIVFFGRFLPLRGSIVSIAAISIGFLLFWFVLADLLSGDLAYRHYTINWITVGSTNITWGILVDRLSLVMLGLITFVSLLVQVYSLEYMKGDPRLGWYFSVHALFAAAMLTLVLADNLLFLYFAWELVGLGSYLLIGFWYEKRSAAEAAKKAFITTRIGDVGLLIGLILLFKATGSFEIKEIFGAAQSGDIGSLTLNISMILIFLGAMGKSAQFPFHVWLPDAMEGPTPVSALIHAATMVAAGVYLVARLLPLFELTPSVLFIISAVGLVTFISAGLLALVMKDLKRILAYSTISHLGLMMLSLGAFGAGAAIFHLVIHGLSKALLFLGAGSIMHGLSDETDIWKMGGLRRKMPITAITFIIGAASLAGIAPLSGFFSKDEILLALLDHRGPLFLSMTLGAIAISSLYMTRVCLVVFFGSQRSNMNQVHESPFLITVPLIILAFLALTVGIFAFSWSGDYRGFIHFLTGEGEFHLIIWLSVLSSLLTLSGVLIGWAIYHKKIISIDYLIKKYPAFYRFLINGYYIDYLYQWIIDRIILALGKIVAVFDRAIVNDVGINGSALSVWRSAVTLKYLQTGKLYNYGLTMTLGVISLILIWWLLLT